MAAQIIDGKAISQQVKDEVALEVAKLKEQGVTPGLAVILVGEDPASNVYVTNKERTAKELGMHSVLHRLPADSSQADVEALVDQLNADPAIHGILVQSPLPKGLDEETIFRRVLPYKDVDGFHPENVGKLWLGDNALVACTPAGCMVLLEKMGVDLKGKKAVVVGRSNIVGKPMAALLLAKHATVTVCHSRTADLPAVCREADVLVAAVGRLQMIKGDWVKPGAVVIDVGINPVPGTKSKIRGDVDFDSAAEVAGAITPVPGGVGPMTIAMLMSNTVKACKMQMK
ncbi:MAG: methylenetetrahydrofolate dehydrogenase/methenyltetrahydrofolate cyclohydrolase [Symbiobacteriaceae bacterium]|jgi:methylenetetrahydrofolate dehydrogenase (NADP+)/methenyltetrahydrofolate cyclohydrolase|nr:methylenetetrahydrofolate dehydrogenase/methenyltetrahydrofolate cyclohydrolase [Symbiobacteriaceae bacterium]